MEWDRTGLAFEFTEHSIGQCVVGFTVGQPQAPVCGIPSQSRPR